MKYLKKQVEFIEEIEKLKTITRFNRTLDGRFENSAEHSWQVALTSIILKDYYPHKIDIEKVLLMLLIHDLGEIYAGDTWVFDDLKKSSAHEKESQSIDKSLSILPIDQFSFLKESWIEFETGNSAEARYARVIDALVPLINHLIVSEKGYNPDNISSKIVMEKKRFIEQESSELWELVQELVNSSIEKGLYNRE
ncbi:HD domain-containing protein [Mammaliicoccus sciuri]|uniref:HD domain-containing protein n=1 Tax=Mammaliicoccus sciuri TaxID=1296 RepID=UPI001FB50C95|nr:HD domain-containing protein [Mammaliicoccus sciuri]MCJ0918810.1 HD domain-containing protein [Mammaliicoccus sciuri]MCJ0958057.1 HD domain-containing protein [Mammaliicoccus sciuri]MCJ0961170.1 HD domain-containing protein [Mammaliicoccus sciuri]MCJ1776790.1 HD domain-containing protein [Mammaliicoccus sciuri]MDC5694199.1 HD domain-containing protein [Mammaliicoccus sciuri]